ncbi:hypothetical protein CEXT_455761 [Caerostris extrusa]|uniref:Uncharacterized protein n=1 Tax=Caerostris extrusa TaxID=172846 RepID=A0AAV4MTV7_CAEEX|nr:hypothetical protein CEXT_455761 [Caerostris extrusa]
MTSWANFAKFGNPTPAKLLIVFYGILKHVVSTEDIPDTVSVTPSSIDTLLHMKRMEAGGNKYFDERLHAEQKHTTV